MRIGLSGPQDFIELAVRRRWWIIAPFLMLSCTIVVLSKSLPKIYVSQSLILAQGRDTKDFVVDLVAGSTGDRLKSIEQQVLSRTNLIAILTEFDAQLPELKELNLDEKVEKLRDRIHTEFPDNKIAQQNSTYFRISYQDRNAELAQKITSKLTTLFIYQDNKVREDQVSGMTGFLKSERDKVSDALREAQSQLKSMKAIHQFELPERIETNLRQLETLTEDKRSNAEALSRNVNTRLTIEQQLSETPAVIARVLPLGPQPMAAPGLPPAPPESPPLTEYRQAVKEFEKVSASNGPGYPDYDTAKTRMARLKGKLSPQELAALSKGPEVPTEPAGSAPAANPDTEANPRYQTLRANLREAQTESSILQNAKAAIEADIEKYKRRVDNTPQTEQQIADVLRQTGELQKRYDEINGNLSKAELSSSLESQQKGSQFTIVDSANLPLEPSKPNKKMVALAGTIGSLLLSLILAVGVDIAYQRVWSQSEVEAFWSVPVLVDIPEILTDGDLAAAQKKKWSFLGYSAGVAAAYGVVLYGIHLYSSVILHKLDPVLQKLVYR